MVELDSVEAGKLGLGARAGATGVGGAGGATEWRRSFPIPHALRSCARRWPAGSRRRRARAWPELGARVVAGDVDRAGGRREAAGRAAQRHGDTGRRAPGRDRAAGAGAARHQRPDPAARAHCLDRRCARATAGAARGAAARPERPLGRRAHSWARPSTSIPVTQRPAFNYRLAGTWPGPRRGAAGRRRRCRPERRSAGAAACRHRPWCNGKGSSGPTCERAPGQFSRVRMPHDDAAAGGLGGAGRHRCRATGIVTVGAEQLLSEEFRARVTGGRRGRGVIRR